MRCESRDRFRLDVNACVMCPPGTYYNISADDCLLCPNGYYNPISGWYSCTPCPFGTWTEGTGKTQATDCKGECSASLVSQTKFPPCSECPVNSYKSSSTQCTVCPTDRLAVSTEHPLLDKCKG
ncbi:signal peptide, CUB and EGF-like domain-containing protein 2 [Gigantopelta aegis]|uniref:signal peptide, CUB and EGF-like domain-containing protein 2 n=1 Tax=Gigantopelta aegis TaxID=1735272 RepID=UPI001B888CEC|nr:signal peptide, CUB and EGF-like domain-containing protein 2 [Gigantopelta aegis]